MAINTSEITDTHMCEMIDNTKHYWVIILSHVPNWNKTGKDKIIWEHGRRNFTLQKDVVLPIVYPINDGSERSGVGVFTGTVDEIKKIMDQDPGVIESLFVYELHDCRSRPETCLP